jgi:hypothetical protein
MLGRLVLAVSIVVLLSSTSEAQRGESPERKPNPSTTIPAPVPTSPQCVRDGAEQKSTGCYDWGQTQSGDTHTCPGGFAMAGGSTNNHFFCVYVGEYESSTVRRANSSDSKTQRYESMACLDGEFAFGLHEKRLELMCATVKDRRAKVADERTVGLGVGGTKGEVLCPGSAGAQLAVVTGWNTMKGQMLCSLLKRTAP